MKATDNGSADFSEAEAGKRKAGATGGSELDDSTRELGAPSGEDLRERFNEMRRNVREDANALGQSLNEATQQAGAYLKEQLQARPYATLGIAAGAGFVLGGGLSLRLSSTLLTVGGRMVASKLLQDVLTPAT